MAGTRGLDPRFRPWADAWLAWLRQVTGEPFVITSGLRTRMEQEALWAKFQRGAKEFTTLPPGRSQHERGFAVDIARTNVRAAEDDLLREAGALWRSMGGVWGGEADPVHFEAPKWMTGRS